MTKPKFNQGSSVRILALIPLAAMLFIAVACVKGNEKQKVVTAVEPVRMNVLYIGVDNPIKIAASGYIASDITVSIDNGTISGNNGEYTIRPKEKGSATVTVQGNGEEIQKTTFRVKTVPDPIAKVAGIKSGEIGKSKLANEDKIIADLENFDFDARFEITGFTVSTVINGKTKQLSSSTSNITSEQKDLISDAKIGQSVYFQDIICVGDDGFPRKIAPIQLIISAE